MWNALRDLISSKAPCNVWNVAQAGTPPGPPAELRQENPVPSHLPREDEVASFKDLQRRHPGQYQDGQLRTLQRRVKQWRALEGPPKEVFFEQRHEPGELCQSDFTNMNNPEQLCAAIFDTARVSFREEPAGALFDHLGADRTYALLARYGVGLG